MIAFSIVVFAIAGIYLVMNFFHDLQMLQQNSYRIPRYWKYLRRDDIGSTWRLTDIAMMFLICSHLVSVGFSFLFVGILSICKIYLIATKKHKKPLVFTKRVWRIFSLCLAISIGFYLWDIFKLGFSESEINYYSGPILSLLILLLMTCFSWLIVIISVFLLKPVETLINKKYLRQASIILKNMPDLKVVGITGSYGKTSTKHFLEHILSEEFSVLMTPGSYNTLMGVVRTIREMMKPYTQIFICEMGAKQKGDIKEICELVKPEVGIITSIGPMHLDTFKTIDNIQATKFELIDSLPKGGLAVINEDSEYCSNRKVENVEVFRYLISKEDIEGHSEEKNIFRAKNIIYDKNGISFNISDNKGFSIDLKTKLIGECNISNIMAAVIVAHNLGMPDEKIRRGVATLEPVTHRLEIKKGIGGITIIDDAFNSNPPGSKMAMEALGSFKEGKRIVITPGMVELGDDQFILNKDFGRSIATNSDIAIIVGLYNREAIAEGIRSQGFIEDNLYLVSDFNEAQKVLHEIVSPGDTVLYENDLPDSFK